MGQRRLEDQGRRAQAVIRRHPGGAAPVAGAERREACGITWGTVREYRRVPVLAVGLPAWEDAQHLQGKPRHDLRYTHVHLS
jgi:hypothetical protein